jgi:hypothetical protein
VVDVEFRGSSARGAKEFVKGKADENQQKLSAKQKAELRRGKKQP